jgi:hypothetical protein
VSDGVHVAEVAAGCLVVGLSTGTMLVAVFAFLFSPHIHRLLPLLLEESHKSLNIDKFTINIIINFDSKL